MITKECDSCRKPFEYYAYSTSIPDFCYPCLRDYRASTTKDGRRKVAKAEKKVVTEKKVEYSQPQLPPVFKYKSTFDDYEDIVFFKRIPRVTQRLMAKYRDIPKITKILHNKA